jgi:hypothetical protein
MQDHREIKLAVLELQRDDDAFRDAIKSLQENQKLSLQNQQTIAVTVARVQEGLDDIKDLVKYHIESNKPHD